MSMCEGTRRWDWVATHDDDFVRDEVVVTLVQEEHGAADTAVGVRVVVPDEQTWAAIVFFAICE